MRLLLVELNRFWSRRAISLLVLATVLLAVTFAGVSAWDTRPLSQADRTDAAAQADLEGERPELQQEVAACREDPTGYLGPEATAGDCETALVPTAESYYPRSPLDLATLLNGEGVGLAIILIGLMLIAGSTFIGADWATGSLSNQLIFESRRGRVWFAKAGAVTISSGLVALVVLSGYWLAMAGFAEAQGITVPSSQVSDIVWHVVRAVALSMGGALGGFALTMVFRHTVATLALLFVYSVGGEIAVNLLPVEGAGRWSVGNNAFGWLATTHRYFDASITCAPGGDCDPMQVMTHLEAGAFLGALLLVAVLVSAVWFRRSDV